mgnify:CR=1 FL=1
MNLQESIWSYTSGVTGVSDLLGTGSSCALYWEDAPVTTEPPYAVYSFDETRPNSFSGNPSIREVAVTVESLATSAAAARAIADAVYTAWMGNEASFTDVTVQGILFNGHRTMGYMDAVNVYGIESDYTFFVTV